MVKETQFYQQITQQEMESAGRLTRVNSGIKMCGKKQRNKICQPPTSEDDT